LAYLVPLTGAATLTTSTLADIRDQLQRHGFSEVVTAAVGPSERDMFTADGFTDREQLHLLRHDLKTNMPASSSRASRIRRGTRRDHAEILAVDHATFDDFWQLDLDGLREAIDATPISRLRIIRDDNAAIIGYSISGRAGEHGYLQRLAVSPAVQGAGLGAALVTDTLHWLRRRGAGVAWVNTQEANAAALRLYERLGFEPAAHRLTVLHRYL
jgi:ribosomal protein S18 acetylase RimI-like enzyme